MAHVFLVKLSKRVVSKWAEIETCTHSSYLVHIICYCPRSRVQELYLLYLRMLDRCLLKQFNRFLCYYYSLFEVLQEVHNTPLDSSLCLFIKRLSGVFALYSY